MARRHRPRHGIVLLIILVLLTLLVVTGLTYAILAGHNRRAAETSARKERYGTPPQELLDRAMCQLVREPRDTKSVAWGHSLLRDLYGVDSLKANVSSASLVAGVGDLLDLQIPTTSNLRVWEGYYTGRVLTFLDGPASGTSVRIINSFVDGGLFHLVVEAPAHDDARKLLVNNNPNLFAGHTILVNGQVFNGTGIGFDPNTGNLDLLANATLLGANVGSLLGSSPQNPKPLALLPNYSATLADVASQSAKGVFHELFGDVDEDYDAPDYQNMLLALVPPGVTSYSNIIPSLHRPALINYWRHRIQFDTNPAALLRAISLRPLPLANLHPNFTGGNANPVLSRSIDPTNPTDVDLLYQALAAGPWDVDNDGDGITDSIWVDLGLPIQTSPDGRTYKPLFAILCVDLDGRININAAASVVQLDASYTPVVQFSPGGETVVAGALNQVPCNRGKGFGPAEINLSPIFGASEFSRILTGRYGTSFRGIPDFRPGMSGPMEGSELLHLKQIGLPDQINLTAAYGGLQNPSAYLDWPDVFGRGAVVLDRTGTPLTAWAGRDWTVNYDPDGGLTNEWPVTAININERLDVPYQMNLVEENGSDNPYGPADQETLLRRWDVDAASQSKRLLQTAPTTCSDPRSRSVLTTQSFDIPAPNTQAPRIRMTSTATTDMRQALGDQRVQPVDLLVARLRANSVTEDQIQGQIDRMLPFELRHGERLDINRVFGNGHDEDGNGATDDPTELTTPENVFRDASLAVVGQYANDYPGAAAYHGRQILARHLFCLMMLLCDEGYEHPVDPNENDSRLATNRREFTVRRIAQWAVNVVDFRDADAIMTPFEYDINPFNGWTADEDLTTTDGESRVVWGCEAPELLITESTAFHDRRVKDTALDDASKSKIGPPSPDTTMDQYRIPQGSLFLEFYCPRSRKENIPVVPKELYSVNPSTREFFLDLARMTPDGQAPVWRVAISEAHHNSDKKPDVRRTTNPESVSFDLGDLTKLPPGTEPFVDLSVYPDPIPTIPTDPRNLVDRLRIERYIWFAPVDPVGLPEAERMRIFWNRSGRDSALVRPSSYAVVGPRPTTVIGSQNPPAPVTPPDYLPSTQRIVLAPGQVQYVHSDGSSGTPDMTIVKPAQTLVAAADPPEAWGNSQVEAPLGIGLNVTEPLPGLNNYYDKPTHYLSDSFEQNGPPVGPLLDSYYDYRKAYSVDPDPQQRNAFPDVPFDSKDGRPLKDDGLLKTGTTSNYKTAFLQRLANPLLPYNAVLNPYITVDWIPIDVTVFNGEDAPTTPADPDDPNPQTPSFESRERADGDAAEAPSLWTYDSQPPQQTTTPRYPSDYFGYQLMHSLGYLNEPLAPGGSNPNHPVGSTLALGSTAPTPAYVGDPLAGPFPWLTWNNRPFVSAYELMLVPASSAGRLLHEYSAAAASAANPYAGTDEYKTFKAPFGHLLNFYHSDLAPSGAGEAAPDFFRIFDFVDVPSPFAGTEKWFYPTQFEPTNDPLRNRPTNTFRPPFNKLSRFRDPGRVNINTAAGESGSDYVWQALTFGFPDPTSAPYWQSCWPEIVTSRRGFPAAEINNFPTGFAGVFRNSVCGDLAPPTFDPPSVVPNYRLRQYGIQATLLRSKNKDAANPGDPLLRVDGSAATQPYRNRDRNPYFYYEGVQRLRNLLTTHSNVYAMWITVGYFEVQPNGQPAVVDAAHPDGYQLGRELGEDTGNVQRHRAFYIIDRSIPVAFEPGENHNVDRAVVLRRFIE
jgi:hypothetical protein